MDKIFRFLSSYTPSHLYRFIGLAFCLPFLSCEPKTEQEKQLVVNWEKLGPGGGGSTFIPTFSYETPQNFLVRCDMTGSYITNDGGISYQQVNFPNGASAYAFDPGDANSIWIGSTTLNHSTDGGKTWELVF